MFKIYKSRKDALTDISSGSPKVGWLFEHSSGSIMAPAETILGFQISSNSNKILTVTFKLPGKFEKVFKVIPGIFYYLFDSGEWPIGVLLTRSMLEYDQSQGTMEILHIFYDHPGRVQLVLNKHQIVDGNTILEVENGHVSVNPN